MTEDDHTEFPGDESAALNEEREFRDEDLPPVEPPSAGFIVQLFVVPALIVLAVVGIWALFGKLAASDQDWQSRVADMRSGNTHRRGRAAYELAQMLIADGRRGDDGQHLSLNPDIAGALAGLLKEQFEKTAPNDEDLDQQQFLATALAHSDVHDVVFPVLLTAIQRERDQNVRKSALASVALISHRAIEDGRTLNSPSLLDGVVDVTFDPEPVIRQMGAFALGLLPSEASKRRLIVLLDDEDDATSLNAAIALARHNQTDGLPVYRKILAAAVETIDPEPVEGQSGEERQSEVDSRPFQRLVATKNILVAVASLAEHFSTEERAEMIALIEPIARDHDEPRIRIEAEKALRSLAGEN